MDSDSKIVPFPCAIKVGGQHININEVDHIGDGLLGECALHLGTIEIAKYVGRSNKPTESSKRNTFFHELTHAILGTMGHPLNDDEQFVSTFSSFLTEAMEDATFFSDSIQV